ncbi:MULTISPECIES: arsenic resistance N-acetyltransferase ArsN2 [Halorussus]|uniref:arsenic resistance N-acetyltransferase ArsN2 n=1 Tax=Halorussus TaxID=1070314 RepID=UPI00209C723F|nr:arsenic resistance N-acetyltransferase ArsN2 [Halorussus vallis]USZ74188.1 arsenic resistance N-acetyltransferase ArsN2 [Halorussus vallis]
MSNQSPVELRPVEPRDEASVEALLDAAGLPTDDLDSGYPSLFVAEAAGERVGVGGLEAYGDAALLRSVAVAESARGRGYGTAVCERLLARARERNFEAVYLLTTGAADFFAELGFEEVERARTPPAVRESAQFDDLCPASATCMKIELR